MQDSHASLPNRLTRREFFATRATGFGPAYDRERKIMIQTIRVLGAFVLLTFVGCGIKETQISDNKETETSQLLTAAGFQQVAADTPEKETLLKSLPTGQLSLIIWKDKELYVQPDLINNRALVGRRVEFESYERLRVEKKMSNDNLIAAQMNRDSMIRWGVWAPNLSGGFDGRTRF